MAVKAVLYAKLEVVVRVAEPVEWGSTSSGEPSVVVQAEKSARHSHWVP